MKLPLKLSISAVDSNMGQFGYKVYPCHFVSKIYGKLCIETSSKIKEARSACFQIALNDSR